MRVRVVQERLFCFQSEGNGEPAAKRLNEASCRELSPNRAQVRNLPTLPARPLQRWAKGFGGKQRGELLWLSGWSEYSARTLILARPCDRVGPSRSGRDFHG